MKSTGILLAWWFAAALSVQGQNPQFPPSQQQPIPQAPPFPQSEPAATSKSVYLDVVESQGSSKTVNHWRDISGNYSQTKTSSRQLNITARNMSALPGEFEIEWYFFGKPASGSGRFLYDKGSKKVTIAPGATEKISVDSKELSNHTVRDYYYWGYNYNSGDKADGWIIRAKVGEEVIRVKASSPILEQLTQDPAAFERLTKDNSPNANATRH